MDDDTGRLEEVREGKKWLIQIPGGAVEEEVPKCEECEKLTFLVEELKTQLENEKRAMDEAIVMVEKMERDHKTALSEQKMLLSFEKDRVILLEKSLEAERKARMEEIYKQDRQSKDFLYVEKDLERSTATTKAMIEEFEAVKKENVALAEAAREIQANKDLILVELQRYEVQLAELEAQNTDLRKRLYASEGEKDILQTQFNRIKTKLEKHLAGGGAPSHFSNKSSKHHLGPLRSTTVCMALYDVHIVVWGLTHGRRDIVIQSLAPRAQHSAITT